MGERNCTFTANNWGTQDAYVDHIGFGMKVTSNEDGTRTRRVMYTRAVHEDGFSVRALFPTLGERDDFARSMLSYAQLASNPDSGIGPMYVILPTRNFVRAGVPTSGIQFGDASGTVMRTLTIQFTAAYNPWEEQPPVPSDAASLPYLTAVFYPVTIGSSVEDRLFNPIPDASLKAYHTGNGKIRAE